MRSVKDSQAAPSERLEVEKRRSGQVAVLARRARTIGMCSLHVLSEGQPGRSPREEEKGKQLNILLDRRVRTIGMCSLDALSEGQSGCSSEREV
jgi:hypothetical protein